MQIAWNTDVNAPCCPGEIVADDGRTLLIQTDWDFPGVASTFGWSVASVVNPRRKSCEHEGTDGTVDCPHCGMKASNFIASARDYLEESDGATEEDPGYFS